MVGDPERRRQRCGAAQRVLVFACCLLAPGCSVARHTCGLSFDPAPRSLIEQSIDCFERGNAAHQASNAACVDWYYASARWAWYAAQEALGEPLHERAAWGQYNTSVDRFVFRAQEYGRLAMPGTARVRVDDEWHEVAVEWHGFPWNVTEFHELEPPPTRLSFPLARRHVQPGRGTPVVVRRHRSCPGPPADQYVPHGAALAATAVLRFDTCAAGTLDFYDPLRVAELELPSGPEPLAADYSAPLPLYFEVAGGTWWDELIPPLEIEQPRLRFLEPYQPGKIPLIYIHGLLSDPQSGGDLANDLRVMPGFVDHYQIWMFHYPTEGNFLSTAARLREELSAAVAACDPTGCDSQLRRMVLVGHSLGGLLAKLQVTFSGEHLWNTAARVPLEAVNTSEPMRAELAQAFYFDPHPSVARVIFIATPHRGAAAASVASWLGPWPVVLASPEQRAYARVIRENPEAFEPYVRRRLPNNFDMLRPNSPLLDAVYKLPLAPGVTLHTVLGISHPGLLCGPSDGIVPARSARHPGVASELPMAASHTMIHRRAEVSAEIGKILAWHAADVTESDDAAEPVPVRYAH